jgi:CheY-like chemotaxis protein
VTSTSVLVVEDDPRLAELYRHWLDAAYHVTVATDGATALDHASAADVVFLDRRLPEVSGDDVLATIRGRHADCYVAVVSAVDPDEAAFALAFDEYLVKPVDRDDLHDAVERGDELSARPERVRTLHRLLEKRRLVESRTVAPELIDSDAAAALSERIERTAACVDEAVPGFDVPQT